MVSSRDWRGAVETTRRRCANNPANSFWVSGEESRKAFAASGSTMIVIGSASIDFSIHLVKRIPMLRLSRLVSSFDVMPAPAIPGAHRSVRPPAVGDLLHALFVGH